MRRPEAPHEFFENDEDLWENGEMQAADNVLPPVPSVEDIDAEWAGGDDDAANDDDPVDANNIELRPLAPAGSDGEDEAPPSDSSDAHNSDDPPRPTAVVSPLERAATHDDVAVYAMNNPAPQTRTERSRTLVDGAEPDDAAQQRPRGTSNAAPAALRRANDASANRFSVRGALERTPGLRRKFQELSLQRKPENPHEVQLNANRQVMDDLFLRRVGNIPRIEAFDFLEDGDNPEEVQLYRAKIFVEDAIYLREQDHFLTHKALRLYDFQNGWIWTAFRNLAIFFLFLMTYYEYPTVGTPVRYTPEIIELVTLIVLGVDTLFRKLTLRNFHKRPYNIMRIIVLVICAGDAIASMASEEYSKVRILRVVRVWWLMDLNRLSRDTGYYLAITSFNLVTTAAMTFALVWVFSLYGIILFCALSPEDPTYFGSMYNAMWSMFICITTANYPDVSFTAVRVSRAYGLFFLVYMVLGLFLVMNLVIGIVYNEYEDNVKRQVNMHYAIRRLALYRAFDCLDADNNGTLDKDEWKKLFQQLHPNDEKLSEIAFTLVDEDQGGTLDVVEFFKLCDLFFMGISKNRRYTLKDMRFPRLWKILRHERFQALTVVLVMLNSVFMAQNMLQLSLDEPLWPFMVDTVFLFYFVAEMIARIVAQGPKAYYARKWQRLDFVLLLISIIGKCLEMYMLFAGKSRDLTWLRTVAYLRALRLIRISFLVDKLRNIFVSTLVAVQTVAWFALYVYIVFYAFSILGMTLYDGLLVEGNPLLNGTDYANAEYWDYSHFNNHFNSMYLLFHLMVLNNWFVTMNGIIAVTSEWSSVYFLFFYFFAVFVVSNLVIAFIIAVLQYAVEDDDTEQADLADGYVLNIGASRRRNLMENMLARDDDEGLNTSHLNTLKRASMILDEGIEEALGHVPDGRLDAVDEVPSASASDGDADNGGGTTPPGDGSSL